MLVTNKRVHIKNVYTGLCYLLYREISTGGWEVKTKNHSDEYILLVATSRSDTSAKIPKEASWVEADDSTWLYEIPNTSYWQETLRTRSSNKLTEWHKLFQTLDRWEDKWDTEEVRNEKIEKIMFHVMRKTSDEVAGFLRVMGADELMCADVMYKCVVAGIKLGRDGAINAIKDLEEKEEWN